MIDDRRVIGWRVRGSVKSWIFFADLQRADSFAHETNATLQECYSDGSVHTISFGDEQALIGEALSAKEGRAF